MPTKVKDSTNADKTTGQQGLFTPQIIISVILCIFCTIMTVICLLNPSIKETSVISPVENMLPIKTITPNDKVVQKFISDDNYVRFGLYYANYSNYVQGGNLHINIKDANNEVDEFVYNIGGIIDNTLMYIDYPLQKDETYTITIYITDGAQGITFFATDSDSNFNAELLHNKEPQDNSIIMSFVTEQNDYFSAWYYIMAIAIIMCYIALKINKDAYVKKTK